MTSDRLIGDAARPVTWTAADAEAAVAAHLRRLWGLPGTRLLVVGAPAVPQEQSFLRWHHWWQSHLLDLLQDAQLRSPTPDRARVITRVYRSILLRTPLLFNGYHDDLAWFALTVQRQGSLPGGAVVVRRIGGRLLAARHPVTGGVRWRTGDTFVNTPATAPTAILLARAGAVVAAGELVDWLHDRLTLPSGLIADGLRPTGLVDHVFTYNQGVVIGAELELIRRGAPADRLHRLVAATADNLAPGGVLVGHGGGDGGLFTGIAARYLSLVARHLPGSSRADQRTRAICAELLRCTSNALISGAAEEAGRPVFSAEPAVPLALSPSSRRVGSRGDPSTPAESDLSTQLGAWMVLEAAAALDSPTLGR